MQLAMLQRVDLLKKSRTRRLFRGVLRSTVKFRLFDDLVQRPFGVTFCHLVERERFDLAGLTCATKGFVTRQTDFFGGFASGFQEVTWIKLIGVFS